MPLLPQSPTTTSPCTLCRFRGEMFGSIAIRSYRMRVRYELWGGAEFDRPLKIRSMRLHGIPLVYKDPVTETKVLQEINDASSLPLAALLCHRELRRYLERGFHGTDLSVKQEASVRFCTACALEQRRDFGVSWWMRDLNLPHVVVCAKHGIGLMFVPLEEVCSGDGFLPHELIAITAPTGVKIDDDVLRQARAVTTLCRESSRIDSYLFNSYIKGLNVPLEHQLWLQSAIEPVSATLHPYVCRQNPHGKRHDGLTDDYWTDFSLAIFAVCSKRPEEVVEDLVKKSNKSISIPKNITEITLLDILGGYKHFNHGRGKTRFLEMLRNNINRSFELYDRNGTLSAWLAQHLAELLVLEQLDPVWTKCIQQKAQWDKYIGDLTHQQRQLAWYILHEIYAGFCAHARHPTRAPAFQSAVAADPIIPAWQESFLSAFLRHGPQSLLDSMRCLPRHV